MRVITGSARGCRLETLAGQATRPTAERVKEGLFSAIQFDIPGRRVLDLFAGSGQLGIEALSRGAASCVFIDQNREAVDIIRRNLNAAKLAEQAQVLTTDAAGYLARTNDTFDVIFLDPPYGAGLLNNVLEPASARLADGGILVCETDDADTLPAETGKVKLYRTYRYGRVYITVYR
jgi:16S rRNA (guanine(966)-N(2))-methyltransferase RsmD